MIPVSKKINSGAGLRFIDLFCGVGGIRLGFEQACRVRDIKTSCVFSADIDKDCALVYKDNFGEDPTNDVTAKDLSGVGDCDVLLAGFPCQTFSISGKGRGFKDKTRGTLFFDILRFIDAKKPNVVLLENVKNLVKHDNGKTLKVIRSSLQKAGYQVFEQVLCSSDFGVPQARERVYIVALRGEGHHFAFPVPDLSCKPVLVADILEPLAALGPEVIPNRKDVTMTKPKNSLPKNVRRPHQIGRLSYGGQGDRIYSTAAAGITLSAFGGGNGSKTGLYLVGRRVRRLSSREAARLQGFPDTFRLHPNYRIACRHMGNSVSVPVIQMVAECILKALDKAK